MCISGPPLLAAVAPPSVHTFICAAAAAAGLITCVGGGGNIHCRYLATRMHFWACAPGPHTHMSIGGMCPVAQPTEATYLPSLVYTSAEQQLLSCYVATRCITATYRPPHIIVLSLGYVPQYHSPHWQPRSNWWCTTLWAHVHHLSCLDCDHKPPAQIMLCSRQLGVCVILSSCCCALYVNALPCCFHVCFVCIHLVYSVGVLGVWCFFA